jgi:hypothetical protein
MQDNMPLASTNKKKQRKAAIIHILTRMGRMEGNPETLPFTIKVLICPN